MYCPICKHTAMHRNQLEADLTAYECSQCSGRWIASYQYWQWQEKSGKSLLASSASDNTSLAVQDNPKAKLCPECGHFLRRFPVGHGVEFLLDHCGNCGGIWFDKNEWEVLKSCGLHDDVHKIFSEIWQNQVRQEQQTRAVEEMYKTRFGPADYAKITDIKQWLQTHPLRSELLAFLKA